MIVKASHKRVRKAGALLCAVAVCVAVAAATKLDLLALNFVHNYVLASASDGGTAPARLLSAPIPAFVLRTFTTANRTAIAEAARNGSDVAPKRWSWFQSWDKRNPRYVQLMFDDNDADRFVRGHFTDRVVAAYFALPMVVQRADLARYLMLYEFGGVYTDMDTVCFTAIDKWSYGLKDVAAIVGVEVFSSENGKDQIAQWTMAFAPRHPFLDYMIRRLTDHILTSPRTVLENLDDVVGLTGPAFWSKAFWDYLRNRGYHIEPHLQGLDRGYRRLGDILLLGRVHFRHPGIFSKHRGTGEMKGGWKHALQLPRLSVGPGERILKAVLQPLLATGVSPLTNVCVFPFRVMRPWVSAPDVQNPSCEVTNPDHVFLTLDAPDVRRFARGVLSGSPNGGGGVVTGAGIDAAGLRVLLDSRLNDPQVRALGPLLSLYHFGGVLIHADTVCRRPLEVWWRDSPRVGLVVGIEEPQTIVFAAKPRHAFVGRLIDGLVLLLNAKSDEELRMINASALAAYHLPTMVTGSLEKLGCTVLRSGKGVMCAGDILLRKRE